MELSQIMAALKPTEAAFLEQALLNPTESTILNSDVELTNEEIWQAISEAKVKKELKIKMEENEVLRRKKSDELLKPFTPDQLIWYCENFYKERFDKPFIFDDSNMLLVKKLSEYFTNSADFEVGGYSLSKGLMIMGNVGTGKTEIMRFFQKNKKQCFTIKSCREIADDYLVYKDELENVYSTPIEKPLHDPSVFFQKYIGYCFDDLGTEENKNAYGNKKNVMADLIMTIYDKPEYTEKGDKDFSKFHITTNLKSKEQIENLYGTRVNSRLREMFNVFVLGGTDRRK